MLSTQGQPDVNLHHLTSISSFPDVVSNTMPAPPDRPDVAPVEMAYTAPRYTPPKTGGGHPVPGSFGSAQRTATPNSKNEVFQYQL